MIDKNGKLFGKINLIDLLIVVIIVAALIFIALRVVDTGAEVQETTPVKISFFGSEVSDYTLDYISVGDPVWDQAEDIELGTVDSITSGVPLGYDINPIGETYHLERDGHVSLSVDVIGEAEIGPHGATIDGKLYGVGHTLVIFAGEAKLYLKVSGIEPIVG